MSNQEELRHLIEYTTERLGLPEPSVVEKDLYVTQALHALCECENPYFKLVFQGGTCLSKAHKVIKRMSEDCDFRIVPLKKSSTLSKQGLRYQLSLFRENLVTQLEKAEFKIFPENIQVRNTGQFMRIELYYESIFKKISSALRPHLLLEFIFTDIRLESVFLPVTTLIKETLGNNIGHLVKSIYCVSCEETLAEKWVALLRRVSNIEHGEEHDNTLIRHLYDINKLLEKISINMQFIELVQNIILDDQTRYKNKNSVYYQNPIEAAKQALIFLKSQAQWKTDWDNLSAFMVFQSEQIEFHVAIQNLLDLSKEIWGKIALI